MSRPRGQEVDRLYQLPAAEFIAARNALARRAGAEGREIRALQKPSLPAWAVNQLFWRKREIYDALVERALDLRATHDAALRGRRADLRGASRAHEESVERAFKAVVALLAEEGHPVTSATRQAVATTLRELPSEEPPGRLTRPLAPRGFGMLSGAPADGRVRVPEKPSATARARRAKGKERPHAHLAAAREEAEAAGRALREAEGAVRREEFDAARAARDAGRAKRSVDAAREVLEEAQAALTEAQNAAAAADRAHEAATARALEAAERLKAARAREQAARAQLGSLRASRD